MSEGLTTSSRKKDPVQESPTQPRIPLRQHQRRPQQRSTDNDLSLATWNLRSLFARGALQNTLADMNKYNIQIAAVQETRWLDSGIHTMPNHSFYFSGPSSNSHQFGTGFIVNNGVDHLIINFVPISKYMCTLRIKLKNQTLSLVNIHAPTELKDDEIKEAFYSELERVYDSLPTSDVRIILGDFNAQIGKEPCYRSVAGLHSLHSSSNDNGSRLAGFALSSGMVIRSTQFQRKDIYKVTWNSND